MKSINLGRVQYAQDDFIGNSAGIVVYGCVIYEIRSNLTDSVREEDDSK